MHPATQTSGIASTHVTDAPGKAPDIASASVPDTLAALRVNAETGLTHAEVDLRRTEHGYNEVAEQPRHPVRMFLRKVLGPVGVDARADHRPLGGAREVL